MQNCIYPLHSLFIHSSQTFELEFNADYLGEDKLGSVDNSKYFKHNETNTENKIENVDITDSVRYSFRLHDQGLTSNKVR